MSAMTVQLDPTVRGPEARNFEQALQQRIVGQAAAVRALADLFQLYEAGLNAPGRPVGNMLFLGPTGSGKTRVVEAAAEILFGDPRAMIKVDCAEFQHSHEIAKLVGSPPGYLGHRETHPLLTQEALVRFHTDQVKLSFLLFDEIEKASDALWQLLLGIMDKATLTLGDNRRVDLSGTVIFLTSNLGAVEMTSLTEAGLGFVPRPQAVEQLGQKMERTAVEAARRKFSPEFMNRLDKIVVFRSLGAGQLEQVLDLELDHVRQRLFSAQRGQFAFRLGAGARRFLLREGTDMRYGARHLKRAIERYLVVPLANLVASDQVGQGDVVAVEYNADRGKLIFGREPGRAVSRSIPQPTRGATAFAAGLTGVREAAPNAIFATASEPRSQWEEAPRVR